MKLMISILIIVIGIFIGLFLLDDKSDEKKIPSQELLFKGPCDSLNRVVDSLQMNYQVLEDNFLRYEATLDLLEEKNPDAAYEFEKIYFDLFE